MKVIVPHEFAATDLVESTVAEPASGESEYDSGTIYVLGDVAISSTTHRAYQALFGGAAQTVTMSIANPGTVSLANHGLAEGSKIAFTTTGSLPPELTASTIYYVREVNADTFNVSTTPASAKIEFTGAGSGTISAYPDPNLGYALTDETAWIDDGPTAKYGAFDLNTNTRTEDDSPVAFTVVFDGGPDNGTDLVDAVALFGVEGAQVNIDFLSAHPSMPVVQYLLLYSEQIDHATWTKTGASVTADPAGIFSPHGTQNVDRLVEDTSTGNHSVKQFVSFTSGQTYPFSVHASGVPIRMTLPGSQFGGGGLSADFDLSAGTVSNVSAGATAAITEVAGPLGTMYRCSIIGTATGSGSGAPEIFMLNGGSSSYTGNGSRYVNLWGANLTKSTALAYYRVTEGSTFSVSRGLIHSHVEDLSVRTEGAWRNYLTSPFNRGHDLVVINVPSGMVTNSQIVVRIQSGPGDSGPVGLAAMAWGLAQDIGEAQLKPVSDRVNQSTVTRDVLTGEATLVPRASFPAVDLTVFADKADVPVILQLRDDLNARVAVWSALDDSTDDYFPATVVLGFYERFLIKMDQPEHAQLQLRLQGI